MLDSRCRNDNFSERGVTTLFANLLGQKAYHKLTEQQMADIIGISRTAYDSKMKTGRFTPAECLAYCKYFGKPFEFLFALEPDTHKAGKP